MSKEKTELLQTISQLLLRSLVVGIAFMVISFAAFMIAGDLVYEIHGAMFGITEHELMVAFYTMMGVTKMMIISLLLCPWIAVQMMLRAEKKPQDIVYGDS